jgi:hypothetical protein
MLPRAVLVRAWCALIAVAVLFGIGQAGTRYFYCEMLGLSATDPCAADAHRKPQCPVSSLERTRRDCCEVLTMPSMPEGARSVEPTVPSACVTAVLPALAGFLASLPEGSVRIAWEGERWRGPPRASRERRAQLMVFLT